MTVNVTELNTEGIEARRSHRRITVLALALFTGAALFVAFDYLVIGAEKLYTPTPDFTSPYLIRTALIFLAALLLVWYVVSESPPKRVIWPGGYFNFSFGRRGKIGFPQTLAALSTNLLAVLAVGLLIASPGYFFILGREDQVVELLSALSGFLAGAYLLFLFFMPKQGKLDGNLPFKLIAVCLAVALIVIAMEEVSWFQRSFGIATPEILGGNRQDEINLHNFASNEVENAYYFAGFLFLILLPFIFERTYFLSKFKTLAFFVPSTNILFASTAMAAFNYNTWNMSTVQFAFFTTLLILVFYLYTAYRQAQTPRAYQLALPALVVVYVGIQVLLLRNGNTTVRQWDVTEYKEFLIPLGFMIYSWELVTKAVKMVPGRLVAWTALIVAGLAFLRLLQMWAS